MISTDQAEPVVIHVVPPNGGGVDRYVRDLCSVRTGDVIAHVSIDQVVLEQQSPARFDIAGDAPSSANAFDALGVTGSLIHAHSTLAPCRGLIKRLQSSAPSLRYVVTLHDVMFCDPNCDAEEQQARLAFVRAASAVIVPSSYIAALATDQLMDGVPITQIEPGLAHHQTINAQRSAGAPTQSVFPIGIVGALGEHKGRDFLLDVVAALPKDLQAVLIGYTDGQITPGWLVENKLWLHGPFQPEDTSALLDAYSCELVFFSNRQAESFSYSLSDVWRAGRPAWVPDDGALGQRVESAAAGWRYRKDANATEVAALMTHCLSNQAQVIELGQNAARAAERLPSIEQFVNQHNDVYRAHACNIKTAINPIDRPESLPHAEMHLNATFFRAELIRLANDLRFSTSKSTELTNELAALAKQYAMRGAEIEKLDQELVQTLLNRDRSIGELNATLSASHELLLTTQRAHASDVAKLTDDVQQTLRAAHRFERALSYLPRPLRRWLLERADRHSR
ncbi:MAG: hypothetical protein EAZ30_06740 [Betaproteobacteria bacterium]|nr:MAG: hypothetical protein EAZ30_06740 [Betaproteobacteria bacterium]